MILDDSNQIKTAIVVVPDRQLSLAIGKEGQNARLAAKLTGWRIDIKSESEAVDEGLDRLSQAQAQALSTPPMVSGDILERAEQFLRDEGEGQVEAKPLGEDALSQAARALEEAGPSGPETAEGMGFDLPSFDEVLAKTDADFEAPAEMPELPSFDDLPEMPALPDEDAAMLGEETEAAAPEARTGSRDGRSRVGRNDALRRRFARGHHRRHVAGTHGATARYRLQRRRLRDSCRAAGRLGRG
ncbi:MAG: hypothetical protein R2838_20335 [Caldilineaceae bacterium]